RLLLSDYPHPVNIGNPDEISILDFAKEVLALVDNPKAHLDHRDLPVDDPKVRRPNISLAKEVLGWEPKVTRAEGLKMTLPYFEGAVLG
ncbi:MAG: SDR family NAD-dependent epimerase/dehydratase, partial [Bacteroidota bacterium]